MSDVLTTAPDVESQIGLTDYKVLHGLVDQLNAKRRRNEIRAAYYDMHNLFRDLGIAIPPSLRNIEVAMGWPAKAVDQLAMRIRFDGFVLPGGNVNDWGIPQMWTENRMNSEFSQAVVSTLIHPPSFLCTTLGDVASGEPQVLVTVDDANRATASWHPTRRAISAYLSVLSSDDDGPNRILFVTPVYAYGITREGQRWGVRRVAHGLGRVPVEPLVYRPRLGDRWAGSSRISRDMMTITDSAMRTAARSEVGAEFFSAPQRYLLGADEEQFVGPNGERKSTWDLVMGRILAIGRDEDGDLPTIGQFPQISMQPHVEHFRMWATMFAGAASLPISSLGVVQDNPSSADAIYAAKEELVLIAEQAGEDWFMPALTRTAVTAVQIRDNLTAPPTELAGLGGRWRNPSTPSRSAATDAVMKQVTLGALPADSDVTLEQLGYDDTTVRRIQADRRRAVGRLVRNQQVTAPNVAGTGN